METFGNPLDDARPDTLDSEMIAEQWRLEEGMTQRGFEAFHRGLASAREHGMEDQTVYGATILLHRLEAVAQGIKGFLEASDTGKPGKRHTAAAPLKAVSPEVAALIALRAVVQGLTMPRTAQTVTTLIGTMIEDEIRLAAFRDAESKAFERMMKGAKERVGYSYKRVYALRIAKQYDEHTPWTRVKKLNVGAKLLDIVIEATGIVELVDQSEGKHTTVKYVVASSEVLSWVDKRVNAVSLMRPQYEPMVVPPRDWVGAYGGGYLSSHIPPLSMVKTRSRAYLEELESVEMPVVYEAINAIQRTPWQVNKRVLDVMAHFWDEGLTHGGLPSRTGIEPPEKPHDIDTNVEARRMWRIKAAKVRRRNMSAKGSRIAVNMTMAVAQRYAKYPRIYFPCQFDFRGRVYSVTTLSPQGSDYTKGLLRFAEGKPLGENGATWLAYQGANLAGNDKVSLEERVQWVLDNEETIYECARDPINNLGWCTEIGGQEIDSPWQFLAFCFEWAGFLEQGESFVSHLPIAMDGSCSGIQHFSAMLRDPIGGAAVNLVPADRPQDVYGLVAKKVNAELAHLIEHGTEDAVSTKGGVTLIREGTKKLAQQWAEFGVTRKVTKRSVMTLAYGSKEYGFRQQLMEDIIKPAMDDATDASGEVDRHAFPFSDDGYAAAGLMAKLIWNAVSATLVAAVEAMKWLQDAASLAASENLPVRWSTAVGFPVMQKYVDTTKVRTEAVLAGKVVRMWMHEDTPTLSRAKMANGISPNFVHSCDAAHLTLTVARGVEQGVTNYAMVHDSFGTTAADMEVFFKVVREAFVELYQGTDVLGAFRDDIVGLLSDENREKLAHLPTKGTLEVGLVRDSRYCFS